MALVVRKWKPAVRKVLLVGVLAISCMSCINVVGICQSIDQVDSSEVFDSIINLSRNGKNVIVFMLDRALGEDVPFIFNEKPELREQFSGFTYYSNVISFGPTTNFATPALFGGYEYTPIELNKRDQESLESKHNEALKVMPVLFSKEGYDVTVCDPPYAGYQWVPDLSIYNDYPEIKKFNTIGNVVDESVNKGISKRNNRNFFCYSMMKVAPSFLQGTLYDNGDYNTNIVSDNSSAFTNAFWVLKNLSNITNVSENENNTFLMIQNDAPHYPRILQEPDYIPADSIDNNAYDNAHADRFSLDGYPVKIENDYQLAHYHVNMATFIQLGKWFEELKRQGVYDNTRIILVSDHGSSVEQSDMLMKDNIDLEFFYPLLMVKDFDSEGFLTSDEFMTNGDVPIIATQGIIDNPINPFSGKQINNVEKTEHDQYVIYSSDWDTNVNDGNTFLPADWYRFHTDHLPWDKNNWTKVGGNTVLKNTED